MGMSSSQARLLTLTARMHDIEYKAQRIEAQKLQLANESDKVYEDYINALDKNKFTASVLGANGQNTDIPLTAAAIYSYDLLNSQYILKTADGKTLIPEDVFNVYNNTSDITEYFDSYGLIDSFDRTARYEDPNPVYTEKYNEWVNDVDAYKTRYQSFLDTHNEWETTIHPVWVDAEPDVEAPKYWTIISNDSLANKFLTAGGRCYDAAINGHTGCYKHVLQHIIEYFPGKGYNPSINNNNSSWYNGINNVYTTTLGAGYTITVANPSGNCHNDNPETALPTFAEVSEKINNESEYKASNADDACNIIVDSSSSNGDKILSKWNVDGTLKSMKQWAIDLYYLCDNYGSLNVNPTTVANSIAVFQTNLVSNLAEFNEVVYETDYVEWIEEEPEEPVWEETEPKLEDYVSGIDPTVSRDGIVQELTFNDPKLAQWYSNLWSEMQGEEDNIQVKSDIVHDYSTGEDKVLYFTETRTKNNISLGTNRVTGTLENENFVVIPNDKLNDAEWLHNLIDGGYVYIQKYSKVQNNFFDTSVAVDVDLKEVPDTVALKKAEAKYEADMKKIDLKDRKYDVDLASIETERNAIKQEMETLKTVAKDNIERTFKLFS